MLIETHVKELTTVPETSSQTSSAQVTACPAGVAELQ